MASKSLVFELYGKDRTASSTMRGVAGEADRMGQTMKRVGFAVAAGLAVAAGAAVAFGISSVKAFAEAQAQQEKLNFAYEKFAAITDVARESYDELNKALMLKTGFDDDAIASGQGVLAQFGLTGKQLQTLTPLLLDYARASGQDVATAAEDMGKAMLGQGRALKNIGIDFKDAGSVAANFDQVMAGLTANVSGYAEQFGTTAAGKFEILTAKWGDFQEKVGAALLPGMERLMAFVESDIMPRLGDFAEWFGTDGVEGIKGFIDGLAWISDNKEASVSAIAAIAAAAWGLSAALSANPVGAVIALIAGGIAWYTSLVGMLNGTIGNISVSFQIMGVIFQTIMAGMAIAVNLFLTPLNLLIDGINRLTGLNIGKFTLTVPGITVPNFGNPANDPGGRTGGRSPLGGTFGGGGVALAEGGLVKGGRGGVFAHIGEKSYDELVVPLKPGMTGFGGTTVTVNVNGVVAGSSAQVAQFLYKQLQDGAKTGAIPRVIGA